MANSTEDSNRHPWKQDAWQERRELKEALKAIPEGYSPHKTVVVDEVHAYAQKCLFEYFSVLEPKRDEFGGGLNPRQASEEDLQESLWWEPIQTISVPADGMVRLNGDASKLAEADDDREVLAAIGDKLPRKNITIRLGNLRSYFQTDNQFRVRASAWLPNRGAVEKPVSETRYLPVSAIVTVRSQLDACLEAAGWLPEATVDTSDAVITEDDIQFADDEVKERILPDSAAASSGDGP